MAGVIAPHESQSPLLRLPRELRERIYGEALENTKGVWILPSEKPPGLLSTCRRTREEASGIYYAWNTFYLTPERCLPWLKRLEVQDRLCIQRIRLLVPMPLPMATKFGTKAMMLLERVPVLRQLRQQLRGKRMNGQLKVEISIRLDNVSHVIWVSEGVPMCDPVRQYCWFVEAAEEDDTIQGEISSFFQNILHKVKWHPRWH